jgi:hypothetical protein
MKRLDGRVVWIGFGTVPTTLSEVEMVRAPSWVVLTDVERQVTNPERAAGKLQPFYDHYRRAYDIYLLSDDQLENVPVWKNLAGEFVLDRDYKQEFAGLRQIAPHWFAGRSYPRYRYRHRLAVVGVEP